MKQVVLYREDKNAEGREKLILLGIENDEASAAARISFYFYHWESEHRNQHMITKSTPIRFERTKCYMWFESLDYFNANRLG